MIIVTFDPGVTTGWSVCDTELKKYYVDQTDSRKLEMVYNILTLWSGENTVFGYEDFKHRPGLSGTELYSKEVIGVIRLWSELHGHSEPFKYLPATAKAFWTDDKIKALGLWHKGLTHGMDALRVLLKYRMDTDPEWFKEVVRDLQ